MRDLLSLTETTRPVQQQYKPDYWEDQLKPTLIETGKELFELPKSLAEVGLSAGSSALGWLVGSGLAVSEATKPESTRESVLMTAEDAAKRIAIEPKTRPAKYFMGKVGQAVDAVAGPVGEAAALVGESWNSPLLEQVVKFAGELAAFEAMGKGGRKVGKALLEPEAPLWYRKMSVRERGVVEGMKNDIASGDLTTAQIRELWKDPANRDTLLKRYQGIGEEATGNVKAAGEPIRATGPEAVKELPAGQGFQLRPTVEEVRDLLATMSEEGPKALPAGQGFELYDKPREIPKPPEVMALEKEIANNEAWIAKNAAYKGTPMYNGISAKTDGLRTKLSELTGEEIKPQAEVAAPAPEIVQPEPTSQAAGALTPSPQAPSVPMKAQGPKAENAQGIIGRINAEGGMNVYDDYNAPEMRQFPDMARVMKRDGMKPDEWAQVLNDEGYNVGTGDDLIELIKSGKARQAYAPEKADTLMERDLLNLENEWAERQAAEKPSIISNQRGSTGPVNESEILSAILKAKGKIQEAMPHLEALGRSVYESGKQTFLEWQAAVKVKLGDMWESFKDHMTALWETVSRPLRNEKGAVGIDINQDPVVKKREIKDKEGKVRYAPEVRQSEMDAVKAMPELRQKPLGGWLENPIRTFEELGEKIKEIFYRPIKEGEHRAKKHFKQIHEKAEAFRKSLPGKSSERIGIYAISQQKGGQAILDAMGIKNVPELTPAEMKAYTWMRTGLENFYWKLQEARAKAGKEGFGKVDNYFTFARQFTLAESMGFSPIFSRMELLNNVMHRKTTPFRYEKRRVGGMTRADLDAFGVFNRYMEAATRHYYLSEPIAKGREMLLTFREGDTKYVLRDEKPAAAKFITEWLDHQAGQRKPQLPNLIEKVLTKLNKNLAFSILSANIRSALIQPTALLNTVAEIGPKWTYEGVKSILDNTAMEKSNVLLSRQFDINVTESLAGVAGKLGKIRQEIGNKGMIPLQWLDIQTAKATWNGAYRKARAEGKPEKIAVNYADDVVTKTQGSAMPSDLSPVQRTALGKALTMFQTFVINQWGFLTRDVLGINNAKVTNKAALKKATAWVVGATLLNSLYEDVIGVPSPLPSPVGAFMDAMEKGEDIPSASMDAAAEIASLIPVVGGGIRYGSSMLGAPAEYIGDIGKKLAPNYVGPTRSTAELVAKGLGIPGTAQLVKSLKIADKGGSPVEIIIGKYPEKAGGKLVDLKGKELKTLKGGLK